MFAKRISSAILGIGTAGLIAASSAWAADIKVSGFVESGFNSYTSASSSPGMGLDVDDAGSSDSFSHMDTGFVESELKIKTMGKTPNGWKAFTEVEFEIGQNGKNDFEMEEASINVDMGSVRLSAGLLEDWAAYDGKADRHTLEKMSRSFGDETSAVRFAYIGNKALYADLKLRMYGDSTTGGNVQVNETRLQGKYKAGWGYVRLIYATESHKTLDDAAIAGDYAHSASKIFVAAAFNLGALKPFAAYGIATDSDTAQAAGSSSVDTKENETLIGVDYKISKETTLTAIYIMQTKDKDSMDDPYSKTALGLGASYNVKPITFEIGYTSASNNYSTAKGSGEDGKYSGIEAAVIYKF